MAACWMTQQGRAGLNHSYDTVTDRACHVCRRVVVGQHRQQGSSSIRARAPSTSSPITAAIKYRNPIQTVSPAWLHFREHHSCWRHQPLYVTIRVTSQKKLSSLFADNALFPLSGLKTISYQRNVFRPDLWINEHINTYICFLPGSPVWCHQLQRIPTPLIYIRSSCYTQNSYLNASQSWKTFR